jgi:hypothetical protein
MTWQVFGLARVDENISFVFSVVIPISFSARESTFRIENSLTRKRVGSLSKSLMTLAERKR